MGSGRSANGYDIFNVINNNRNFLSGGGHKQAAGVKLSNENIDKFRELCNEDYAGFEKTAGIDEVTKNAICELDINLITNSLIDNLNMLEPYGKGNEKPTFILKHVRLKDISFIGKNESTLKFKACSDSSCDCIDAIGFSNISDKYKELGSPKNLDILCTIGYNGWMGRNTKQIMIEDIRLPESYGSEDLDLNRL
jgi:single-stranded-DNA-specific exonuclease